MLTFNNKILTVSNKGLEVEAGPTPPGPTPSLPFDYVQIGNQLWSLDIQINDTGSELSEHGSDSYNAGIFPVDLGTIGGRNFGTTYWYSPAAVTRIASSIASQYPGWHLPTLNEYNTMYSSAGSDTVPLKATDGWNTSYLGTNTTGFTSYGKGQVWISGDASWWDPTLQQDQGEAGYYLTSDNNVIGPRKYYWTSGTAPINKLWVYQFRLVKDAEGV